MDRADFLQISNKVLNPEDKANALQLLNEGDIDAAKIYLLLGIDRAFIMGNLKTEEAAPMYERLDIPKETACKIRQSRARPSFHAD